MWWFCLDQWFMIPHFHLNVKNLSWVWNDRLLRSRRTVVVFLKCDDFVSKNDLWSPFSSEYEKYIVKFEMIDFIDVWWAVVFFECDDFVWTNDLWFLIYIWMWKIYREFWNDRLHWGLDEQLWFFLNVMILSRPMIYDSPFSSECEKFIVSFEMIDFLRSRRTVVIFLKCDDFVSKNDLWSPFSSEYEKYIVKFEMMTSLTFDEQLLFFECDDFVWTNDLWFLIYIWMWKIYREFWNDRLHWGLDEQLWFFLNVMILSRPMIYDPSFSSEYENSSFTSWNLKW